MIYSGKKSMSGILSVLIFVVLLSSTASGMGRQQKLPRIDIQSPEAKLSPVILGSASVFMKISNAGESDDTLTGARVDIPGAIAEIHDMKDGKMVKAEEIRIPSKDIVELKSGGLHIMVFKMPEDMKEGDEFKMHLVFEKSGERQINIKLTGVDTHMHMHH
jgi:copper(I)-binding protein